MSMLQVGERAPEFDLPDVEGTPYRLDAQAAPLTLALFFKTTCPTCQYAWPYYERFHRAYAPSGLRVLGISQHDAARTRAYRDECEATFPHLIDRDFAASRAYDPTFVPSGFLIDARGNIVETFESWNSKHLNELSERIASRLGVHAQNIVRPEDHALENKIG